MLLHHVSVLLASHLDMLRLQHGESSTRLRQQVRKKFKLLSGTASSNVSNPLVMKCKQPDCKQCIGGASDAYAGPASSELSSARLVSSPAYLPKDSGASHDK